MSICTYFSHVAGRGTGDHDQVGQEGSDADNIDTGGEGGDSDAGTAGNKMI